MRNGFFAVAVLAFGITAPLRADEKPPELKMGMLQGMFRDVHPAMVQAVSKPFKDLIFKQTGFSGDVDLCPDAFGLIEKLKEKKLQIGVFHGHEFAWAQKKCPELIPIVVTIPPGGKAQSMIVVSVDSKAKSLADLADEPITLPRGTKAYSFAFLEKARTGLAKGVAKSVTKLGMNTEDLLNGVVGGEVAAALVDASTLDGYKTLQPGAFKQLRILLLSEPFPPAVVAYRKGSLSEEDAAKIRLGLSTANATASGKLLMTLWNLKGLEEPPVDFQDKLDTILKAYPIPEGK
jgi:ABC-type phosphate/phosphonate transport system substrate-binding protein